MSKIKPVKEILEGDISSDELIQLTEVLKNLRYDVPDNFSKVKDFYIKVERKCSPEFLIAGDASVCCMSYGSGKAKIYALEKGFGIINAYYKGKIIANSLIWVNTQFNCLVLDNIEVNLNYTKYNDILSILFLNISNKIIEEYDLNFAVQGNTYNDLYLINNKGSYIYKSFYNSSYCCDFQNKVKTLEDIEHHNKISLNLDYSLEIQRSFYSDATVCFVIKETIKDFDEFYKTFSALNEKQIVPKTGDDEFFEIEVNPDNRDIYDDDIDWCNVALPFD